MRTNEITRKMLALGLTRQQAFELIAHFCGMSKSEVLLDREADEAECMAAAEELVGGKPLQYILGEWDFLGRRIICREGVLIPREDTETVVREALKYIKRGSKVLDLCCGSGCIAVSAAAEGADVTAVDISPLAIKLTEDNAKLWGVEVAAKQADLLSDVIEGSYDVMISNPPYIRSRDIRKLDASVRVYEPHGALDGGEDGLAFYRCILGRHSALLKSGGRLVFEIGFDQAEQVSSMMEEKGFSDIRVIKDGADLPRCVSGARI